MKMLLLLLFSLMCPGGGSDGDSSECKSSDNAEERDIPSKVVSREEEFPQEEHCLKKVQSGHWLVLQHISRKPKLRQTKSNVAVLSAKLRAEQNHDRTEREGEGDVLSALENWSSIKDARERRKNEKGRYCQS